MKLRGSSYFLIVIIVIMLVTIGASLRMEAFASKLLPLVFGGMILFLAAIGLWREITAGSELKTAVTDDETGGGEEANEGLRGYLVHGGWVIGFALGIWLLGFLISIPIFLVAYMRWLGTRWPTAISSAIVIPGILYALFELLLKIILYRGLLLTWLGY